MTDEVLRKTPPTLGRHRSAQLRHLPSPRKSVSQPSFPSRPFNYIRQSFRSDGQNLDAGATGPLFLRRPEIAEMVVAAIRDGDRRFHRYELHAFVVMANHVHMLVTPKVSSTRWLGPLKGFTSTRRTMFSIAAASLSGKTKATTIS